ncbi:hypothetical protein FIBSPDRAFT_865403, partial [Athelia psychrophila]
HGSSTFIRWVEWKRRARASCSASVIDRNKEQEGASREENCKVTVCHQRQTHVTPCVSKHMDDDGSKRLIGLVNSKW